MTPKCLLIYSPTHATHVSAMAELAKYLRCCNINAMIDMLDIAETASKVSKLCINRYICKIMVFAVKETQNKIQ